jgi:hypothetical protein
MGRDVDTKQAFSTMPEPSAAVVWAEGGGQQGFQTAEIASLPQMTTAVIRRCFLPKILSTVRTYIFLFLFLKANRAQY